MTVAVNGIPMMRVTPSAGVMPTGPGADAGGTDFGAALHSAIESAVDTGHDAEAASMKAITQGGNVTEVATALARAEMTLQTATAVRDRMLQAYQDIMRIQI
jgi:flagellar hook-basal body complex protein FliE